MSIVAAAMVKSTGSQSSASRSHGSLIVATSTLNSGMIATEARLMKLGADTTRIKNLIKGFVEDTTAAKVKARPDVEDGWLTGTATGGKTKIESSHNQYYNSRIAELVRQSDTIFAKVEVASGMSESGRSVRKAMVFGELAGVQVQIGDDAGADNAIFVRGSTNNISNQGIVIPKGNATYMNNLEIQRNVNVNDGTVWVERSVDNKGRTCSSGSSSQSGPCYVYDTSGSQGTTNKPVPANRIERELDRSFLTSGSTVTVSDVGNNPSYNVSNSQATGPYRYRIAEGSGVNFNIPMNVALLQKMHAHASGPPSRLYNGHLVVEVNNENHWKFANNNNVALNVNVIFVIKKKYDLTNFPSNNSTSSTLIYVDGPDGTLDQFTLPNTFRGLVYVDRNNSKPQRIAGGCNVSGAIHMMGNGAFEWNSGGNCNNTTTITYDRTILDNFPRVGGSSTQSPGDPNATVTISPTGINFIPYGYYFH